LSIVFMTSFVMSVISAVAAVIAAISGVWALYINLRDRRPHLNVDLILDENGDRTGERLSAMIKVINPSQKKTFIYSVIFDSENSSSIGIGECRSVVSHLEARTGSDPYSFPFEIYPEDRSQYFHFSLQALAAELQKNGESGEVYVTPKIKYGESGEAKAETFKVKVDTWADPGSDV